jgi:hypothetical protein
MYSLIFRCWSMGAGVLSIYFVANFYSVAQQGLYYAMLSVLAMQMIFELGLNQVLMQISSRFIVVGKIRVAYLIYASTRWFLVVSIVYFLCAYFYGQKVFGFDLPSVPMGRNFWLAMVIFSAWNLVIAAKLAIYEGCGASEGVYKFKLAQAVIGSCIFWFALFKGFGIWAMIASNVVGVILHYSLKKMLFSSYSISRSFNKLRMFTIWRRKIYPLQWRISLTWLSGYLFTGYLISLVYIYNPVVAGKYGMSIAIFASIQAFFVAAFNIRLPQMTALIVRKDMLSKSYFYQSISQLTLLYFIVIIGFYFVILMLEKYDYKIIERLSSIYLLIGLGFIGVINFFGYCVNSYMRAKGKDRSWLISICSVITLIFCIKIFEFNTDLELTLLVFIVNLLMILPYNLYLLNNEQ